MAKAVIKVNKLSVNTTMCVKIRGLKELSLRIWIAKWLIILAAKILGCGIDIKEMSEQ